MRLSLYGKGTQGEASSSILPWPFQALLLLWVQALFSLLSPFWRNSWQVESIQEGMLRTPQFSVSLLIPRVA